MIRAQLKVQKTPRGEHNPPTFYIFSASLLDFGKRCLGKPSPDVSRVPGGWQRRPGAVPAGRQWEAAVPRRSPGTRRRRWGQRRPRQRGTGAPRHNPTSPATPRPLLGGGILGGIIFALGTSLIIYRSSHSGGAFSHELSAARFFDLNNNPQNVLCILNSSSKHRTRGKPEATARGGGGPSQERSLK